MQSIDLKYLITDKENVKSYITYREVEDWCYNNISSTQWRFDYSGTICVCGIDIPGRIFFWSEKDASAFKLKFKIV